MAVGLHGRDTARVTYLAATFAVIASKLIHAAAWYSHEIPYHACAHTAMYRSPDASYRIFQNLWYHNSKYFAVVPDPASTAVSESIGSTIKAVYFPAADGETFVRSIRPAWVPGTTLGIDFVFPSYPDNHGHWTEALFPMLSALSDGSWSHHIQGNGTGTAKFDRVFLMNVDADQLSDWVKETLTVALGADSPGRLPPLLDTVDIKDVDKLSWVGFENLIMVTDRYTDASSPADKLQQRQEGVRPERERPPPKPRDDAEGTSRFGHGCETVEPADWPFALRTADSADLYRQRAYRRANLPPPPLLDSWQPIPRQITILRAAEGEEVVNHDDLVRRLSAVAMDAGWRVRQFTATPEAPSASLVATMAATGVLVARHGALLASAALLPPGAAVYELLPFNWEWRRLGELFRNITRSTGHLHHFAWRPTDSKWAHYASHDDRHRYQAFRASECTSKTCLLVHARAGLRVDVDAVSADVLELLPRLEDSSDGCEDVACRIDNLCRGWPPAEVVAKESADGTHGRK